MGWTRMVDFPLSLDQLKPDATICTHVHLDHLDPKGIPEIARTYLACCFWGPSTVVDRCRELGIPPERTGRMNVGTGVAFGPFQVTSVPACHGKTEAIGLLLQTGNSVVYMSGDTEYEPRLAQAIRDIVRHVDLSIVCINGRLGNMSAPQAAILASELDSRVAIPMHFGLFRENTVSPDEFVAYCGILGIGARPLDVGVPYSLAEIIPRGHSHES